MAEKEADVQRRVLEYLTYKRHFFWRVNNVGMYDPVKKIYRRMPKYSKRGAPDIILIIGGQFIGLECKGARGKLSEDQEKFKQECESAGGIYKVVKGIQDLEELGL